jgi:DNA-binding IclR family transcriptional regulator
VSVNSPAVNGVRTIAAPIFEGETIIAAMAIVGTTVSVPDDIESPMATALVETTRALSQRLGNATGAGSDASSPVA